MVTILFCNQSYGQKALFGVVRDKIETLVFGGQVVVPPPVLSLEAERLQKYEGVYKFSNGGHLEVEARGNSLIIKAIEQKAINTLFFPEKVDPDLSPSLNKLSVSIFEAVLKGDFKPIENVLENREKRSGPVRRLIEMRINRQKKRTGAIKEVLARATIPSFLRGAQASMTIVQLRGEKESLFFALYWRDHKNIGVGPLMSMPDFSAPFLALTDHEFAGYHLDMALDMRVSFNSDDKGEITSLTVHSPQADVSASKL